MWPCGTLKICLNTLFFFFSLLRESHGTGVVIRYSALSTDLQPVGDFNSENDVSTEFCRSSSGIFTRTAQ